MSIKTKRLEIRKFVKEDLKDFKKLLDIPEVPGWQMQRERAEDFLQWHIGKYKKMDVISDVVCFGLFEKESGEIIGAAGLGEHDDLHETEIFYHLLPDKRGSGYATEAAKAITLWGLTEYDLSYIVGTADEKNIASRVVLEKCGYELVDNRNLLVHITGEKHEFFYYRCFS